MPAVTHSTLHTEFEMLEALAQRLKACERDIQQQITEYRLRPMVDHFRSVRVVE
ncbi:MAG: hypothetical protein OXG15_01150 [Gammaproteobacteria bacterium]|nr:hypothetical protein [Gammaproteobacteria bacterium]